MAISVVGLSLHDAYCLTLDEFNAAYDEWNTLETARYQAGWEQARFIAHCALIPHTRKGFTPTDLVRFDWDTTAKTEAKPATMKDFERIRGRFGEG